jgi:hypothetical protein
MAREIHEREDLLRDAVALVPRVLFRLQLSGRRVELFAGFRGESLSLYLDDDPVYHFNDRGELRRAFIEGRLIKAEHGRLVSLMRKRTEQEVALERQSGSEDASREVSARLAQILSDLVAEMNANRFEVVGQIPEDGDAAVRVSAWLNRYRNPMIAASPHVG